ncbi:MAG: AraC family transcriptional regulator [Oscillospiraceae bacterium]|nr:AraC family transcriptional regulator [Oscillospiraceae bacterium]
MTCIIELNDNLSEKIHYDRSDYPIYIRRGVLSEYPNYAAPSHWHTDIELIAVLEGEMSYSVNGQIIRLRQGEGIFVNAQQIHFGFSDSRTECHFICVILHPMLLCAAPAYEQDFVLPVIHSGSIPFVALSPGIDWQRDILRQIHLIDQSKGLKTAPLKVQSAFSEIWSLLYENLPQEDPAANPQGGDLTAARNMAGFIQKNYTRRISLKEIALSGAVGQSKCCKLFAKYFGQTPNTYLNQYRLNKSLELLRNTDLSVTEIALSVGFSGASYYTEIFGKYFGKSPSQFRKTARPEG